jgi:hypothetical protein
MNKDEVWETIKNDKSTIYGQPIFDVFLQITNFLSEPHFLELNEEQKSKLSGDVLFNLLYYARDIKKIADLIKNNINKLSENHIYDLLARDDNDLKNNELAGLYKKENYLRQDAILQYKNINGNDFYALLSRCDHINCLAEMIEKIGEEKLNDLEPHSISRLLKKFQYIDNSGDAFEFFAKKLKSNIEKIPNDKVVELMPSYSGGPNNLGARDHGHTWDDQLNRIEKIMNSLGEKNLDKLNDRAIKSLLTYGPMKFRLKIASTLGDLRNKLSNESISYLLDQLMRSESTTPKIVDLVGEKRFRQWFESSEGQKEIKEWERVINLQDKKQHTQKTLDAFRSNLDSLHQRLGKTDE